MSSLFSHLPAAFPRSRRSGWPICLDLFVPKEVSDIDLWFREFVVLDSLTRHASLSISARFVGFSAGVAGNLHFKTRTLFHPFLILAFFIFHFRAICCYGLGVCTLFAHRPPMQYAVWNTNSAPRIVW